MILRHGQKHTHVRLKDFRSSSVTIVSFVFIFQHFEVTEILMYLLGFGSIISHCWVQFLIEVKWPYSRSHIAHVVLPQELSDFNAQTWIASVENSAGKLNDSERGQLYESRINHSWIIRIVLSSCDLRPIHIQDYDVMSFKLHYYNVVVYLYSCRAYCTFIR